METKYVKQKKNQSKFDIIVDGEKIGTTTKAPLTDRSLRDLIERKSKRKKNG